MVMKKRLLVTAAAVCGIATMSGCSLLPTKSSTDIDPPKTVVYKSDQPSKEVAKKEETVKRELYLIDRNGYVVPQTFQLPKSTSLAKQALEYLVKDGPVTDELPNGFQAVLPPNTEVLGVQTQKDGTIIADFSPEFKQYRAEDELKVFQAVTWTLTQFDNVTKVKIRVNGKELASMPINKAQIGDGLTRDDGINFDKGDIVDIMNSRPVTLYYVSQGEMGDTYYVPVTTRISNAQTDSYSAIVNELVKGPSEYSNLVSDFGTDTKLVSQPVFKGGKLVLNFNDGIYGNIAKNMINNDVLQPLVLSLTEQKGVKSIEIQINGKLTALDQQGKPLSQPVSRPKDVNTKKL
ncbi:MULTISPECIES: GerMN domain-containing protein [Bacillaceae]|jgi:germination protein M|nr:MULTISPECIES: GerMN domain-containing protein [Bacillaceae]